MTSVLIVDDHAVFREGLRALLAKIPDTHVAGEAATTDEAVDLAAELQPDVILMDLSLPGEGGAEATRRILRASPGTPVLVLTMHEDDAHVRDALAAGARGYLLKDAEPAAIIRAIHAVSDGQMILDSGAAAVLVTAAGEPTARSAFPTLTSREHEILDRLARGLRNDAIAARMGLSVKTVQNNVSTILIKLGAQDRSHLVALARDRGLGAS